MAPPTRILSALASRLPITGNLSATFAPPSTTAYGRLMFSVSRRSAAVSACTR